MVQKAVDDAAAEIVWVTHRVREADIRGALDVIDRLPVVESVDSWFRVEE